MLLGDQIPGRRPNPLADMGRGGPNPLADLVREDHIREGANPLGHRESILLSPTPFQRRCKTISPSLPLY